MSWQELSQLQAKHAREHGQDLIGNPTITPFRETLDSRTLGIIGLLIEERIDTIEAESQLGPSWQAAVQAYFSNLAEQMWVAQGGPKYQEAFAQFKAVSEWIVAHHA